MRHQNIGRALSRTSSHRKALFKHLSVALIKHEVIHTTLAKAKELRRYAEPMMTMAKKDTVAQRRLAHSRLRDHEAVAKLFSTLGPRYLTRPGGYLRIFKHGYRKGDNAPMAVVILVGCPQEQALREESGT